MKPIPSLATTLACALGLALSATAGRNQQPDDYSAALVRFAEAFDAQELHLDAPPRVRGKASPVYGALLGTDAELAEAKEHRFALSRMIATVSRQADPAGLRALIRLAAVGTGRPLLDRETAEVRARARRAAVGWNRIGQWQEITDLVEGTEPVAAPVRAAAVELMGRATGGDYESSLAKALGGGSDAVRLAAAEALRRHGTPRSLGPLARALRVEPHAIAALAITEALDEELLRAVRDHEDRLARPAATRAALHALGRHGWRCDYALVELLEGHPVPDAMPALIRVLEQCQAEGDDLERALNERAREVLARRTHQALRRLTGALQPQQPDASAWRAFWEAERDRLVLPDCPALSDANAATRGGFFGIPIAGREIVFVIDNSGSMGYRVQVQDRDGEHEMTRLALARREMLRAAQSLDASARYHLLTFASTTLMWNRVPVPPNAESHRQLAGCLDRIEADDSTNLFGALQAVFDCVGDPQQPREGGQGIDEVFLLSDGEPTTGEVTAADLLLEMVDRANELHRIRFHCVHLGGGGGSQLLRELAQRNDGVFVQR